jgi:hypothetical protein
VTVWSRAIHSLTWMYRLQSFHAIACARHSTSNCECRLSVGSCGRDFFLVGSLARRRTGAEN